MTDGEVVSWTIVAAIWGWFCALLLIMLCYKIGDWWRAFWWWRGRHERARQQAEYERLYAETDKFRYWRYR